MSLRDEAITHMKAGILEHGRSEGSQVLAEAALDALLLFLTEHIEEWTDLADALVQDHLDQPNFEMGVAMEPGAFVDRISESLVAALRGPS